MSDSKRPIISGPTKPSTDDDRKSADIVTAIENEAAVENYKPPDERQSNRFVFDPNPDAADQQLPTAWTKIEQPTTTAVSNAVVCLPTDICRFVGDYYGPVVLTPAITGARLLAACAGHPSIAIQNDATAPTIIPLPAETGSYYFVFELSQPSVITSIVLANAGTAFLTIRFASAQQSADLLTAMMASDSRSTDLANLSVRGAGPTGYEPLMAPAEQQLRNWSTVLPDKQLLSREQLSARNLKSIGRIWTFRMPVRTIQPVSMICVEARPFVDPILAAGSTKPVPRSVGIRWISFFGTAAA